MTDEQNGPEAEQSAPEPERAGPATGFAAYDKTLLRFSGPVRKTKAEARADIKSAPEAHDLEVREV